jgi:hypothetical protein
MDLPAMPDASTHLILVAGTPGSGKTRWIRSQVESIKSGCAYFVQIGAEDFPLDAVFLAQSCDNLQVLTQMPTAEMSELALLYVECGYPIEVQSLPLPEDLPIRRIVVLPPEAPMENWETWADEVVVGSSAPIAPPELWRLKLSGQILETASLEIFWQELSWGAYGTVDRAKGIFEVSEGIPLFAEFIQGHDTPEMIELNLPRHLSGRPDRFSGIEVLGTDLDTGAIVETLKLCFLKDDQVVSYQAQVRSALLDEENNS